MSSYTKLKFKKWSHDSSWELIKDVRNYNYLSFIGFFYILNKNLDFYLNIFLVLSMAFSLIFILISLWFQYLDHLDLQDKSHSNKETIEDIDEDSIVENESASFYWFLYIALFVIFIINTILIPVTFIIYLRIYFIL